jgi:mRNA guanylyltransferase
MAAKISIAAPGIKAEPHLAQSFREEVSALLDRDSLNFPGAQPVSFARRHLEELNKQEYVLNILNLPT